MIKYFFMVYCFLIISWRTHSAPTEYNQNRNISTSMIRAKEKPKMFWNFIGDVLSATGFLPIEVNVPDTIGAIAGGAQNVYNGISTITSNVVQQIPFINRLTSSEKPRIPLYVLLLSSARSSPNKPQLNMFLPAINLQEYRKLHNTKQN